MFRLRIMRAEYLTRAGVKNYQFMVVSTSTKKKNKSKLNFAEIKTFINFAL